jgi:hypothetical protein
MQIVSLQEIVHPNIVINVAPILLLVFLLVLNCICHQLHRETTKGKNSQKFVFEWSYLLRRCIEVRWYIN